MGNIEERTRLLIGEDALARLHQATVLVAGVGGVGSYAVEALARSGIGHLILIDKDCVEGSNLNRQMMATQLTIGQPKTEAMIERIHTYAPDCQVVGIQEFFNQETAGRIQGVDFAIDAIDTVSSKLDFMEECLREEVPFVSSLGMGNRLDPSKVVLKDLWETSGDPLARSVREMARKRGLNGKKIPVLFSTEEPRIIQREVVDPDGSTRKQRTPPASCVFVPAAAGLLAASVAVRTLMEGKEK